MLKAFDGVQVNGTDKIPDRPHKIYPGELVYLGQIVEPNYSSIVVKKDKILTTTVTIEYDAPAKHEKECEKLRFDPVIGGFIRLGACGN